MLRPPSDDDRVSGLSGVLNNAFCNLQNGFAVDQVEFVRIQAAFITSAQKGFEEPIVERISAFLANLDDVLGTICQPGDLFRQVLIPQLPAQLLGKQLSNFATAASIFPFNRKYSNHLGPLSPFTSKHNPTANEFISLILPKPCHRRDRSSSVQKPGKT